MQTVVELLEKRGGTNAGEMIGLDDDVAQSLIHQGIASFVEAIDPIPESVSSEQLDTLRQRRIELTQELQNVRERLQTAHEHMEKLEEQRTDALIYGKTSELDIKREQVASQIEILTVEADQLSAALSTLRVRLGDAASEAREPLVAELRQRQIDTLDGLTDALELVLQCDQRLRDIYAEATAKLPAPHWLGQQGEIPLLRSSVTEGRVKQLRKVLTRLRAR